MNIGVEQPSTIKDKIRDLEAQVCWDLIRQQIRNLRFLIMFLVGWDTCKFENGKSVGLRRTVRRRGHVTIRTCSIIGHFGHDKEQRRRFDSWTSKNNSRKIIENRFAEGEIKTGSFQDQFKKKIGIFLFASGLNFVSESTSWIGCRNTWRDFEIECRARWANFSIAKRRKNVAATEIPAKSTFLLYWSKVNSHWWRYWSLIYVQTSTKAFTFRNIFS